MSHGRGAVHPNLDRGPGIVRQDAYSRIGLNLEGFRRPDIRVESHPPRGFVYFAKHNRPQLWPRLRESRDGDEVIRRLSIGGPFAQNAPNRGSNFG